MLANDHRSILCALGKADCSPLVLEEIAATASLSFERAWYAVLELIELRFLTPAGIGFYSLTFKGSKMARQLAVCG